MHAEVKGLRAGADHFFQFDSGGEESRVGHFRTAPDRDEWARRLTFAVATCQDHPSGFYTAYRDMVRNDLDLVLHLGDYTYEYFIGRSNRGGPAGRVRGGDGRPAHVPAPPHAVQARSRPPSRPRRLPVPRGVGRPRGRQRLLGAGAGGRGTVAEFTARRAAAYQAFYEHLPIRLARATRTEDTLRIYRRVPYGRLAEFTMLDDRQYRTDNPCGDGESLRCDGRPG